MGRVTDDPHTWGALNTLNINGYHLDVFGATTRHLSIISDTLSKIPPRHVSLIPRVVVGDIVGGGRIARGGNSVNRPPNPRLELSTGAMNNPQKLVAARAGGNIHITVLHETGHHVDWRLGITSGLSRELLEELGRWFQTIGYRGVTTGSGEARAEIYWRLFARTSTLPNALRTAIAERLGIA
jgi:hypothetical protein